MDRVGVHLGRNQVHRTFSVGVGVHRHARNGIGRHQ
jgi:hypothetical protein